MSDKTIILNMPRYSGKGKFLADLSNKTGVRVIVPFIADVQRYKDMYNCQNAIEAQKFMKLVKQNDIIKTIWGNVLVDEMQLQQNIIKQLEDCGINVWVATTTTKELNEICTLMYNELVL